MEANILSTIYLLLFILTFITLNIVSIKYIEAKDEIKKLKKKYEMPKLINIDGVCSYKYENGKLIINHIKDRMKHTDT